MGASHSSSRRLRRNRGGVRFHMVGGHDRWMVSYADFLTLLFAFFTMMYAISKVDIAKLNSMVSSMQLAFVSGGRTPPPARGAVQARMEPAPTSVESDDVDLHRRLKERLSKEMQDGHLSLDVDSRGVVISMFESGSFAVGSADLTPSARDVLTTIAATVVDLDETIRVEGHTDDVPIRTPRFASNWDLSTARAINVVQFLVETAGLAPGRLSVSGYGEFHPRVPNDSPENRARNRRVDLVVLNAVKRAEEPGSPTGAGGRSPDGASRTRTEGAR